MKIKIKFDDFKKLDKELAFLENHIVVIGVLGDEESEDGVPVKEYAIHVEYGAPRINIPARPFFRTATQSRKAHLKILHYSKARIREIIEGKITAKQALEDIGTFVMGEIIQSLKGGNWKANSPATIKKKGKNNPLLDKGTLLESINFEIRRK